MHRIIFMCLDAGIALVFIIPVFLYLNKHLFHSKKHTVGYILFAGYLCAMFSVVGLPDILYIRFDPTFNIIPFAYMFSDFMNSLLNVILFVPLGFFLPFFWKKFRSIVYVLFFGFVTSLLIELLQIFTYRATDINDLMTNTFGTLIGWTVYQLFHRFFPHGEENAEERDLRWICGSVLVVMVFFQPFLADWLTAFSL